MKEEFEKEQRIKKRIWKFDQGMRKATLLLYEAFFVILLVMAIIFGLNGYRRQLNASIAGLVALIFAFSVAKLIRYSIKRYFLRDELFTVGDLELPETGVIDVEKALHRMIYSVGSLGCITISSTIVGFLLLGQLITQRGNTLLIITS